ncbi:MAG: toprim domain-containing protein [Anaerolineae bacterium]|nr:toprim domain-containing protein [Anaerolineae bacterium]
MLTTIEAIKAAVNICNLINEKHPIEDGQGRYRRAKGHDSLVIDTHKQNYYWNSKGESGDIIDWVGRHELGYDGQWNSSDSLLFKEAVIWLTKHAGMPEPQFKPEDTEARAQRLAKDRLMSLAAEYYQNNLHQREIQAYNYALSRGFTPKTIAKAMGYADGQLWQAIPQQDRPTAMNMGLIATKGATYRDTIPAGYLVYIHHHRSKVEYLTGRAITSNDPKKKSRNQRSPKRMLWTDWHGYNKPLIICEGQADALSLAQMGFNALAMCGVNLSDFDADLCQLFTPLYVWQDADAPDSEAARAWLRRLANLVDTLGPLIRIINSPAKDANQFLQDDGAPDHLEELLREAPTFLDQEIQRLSPLRGAELYDELEPFFARLSTLDIFQLNIYRSKSCKELNISQGDFGRYLKAAKGLLTDDDEASFAKGGQYCLIDGWTVMKMITAEGNHRIVPLANGTAKILEEVINDDGSNDSAMDFIVGGELATGQKLPKITIPAADFPSMKWVGQWGSRFILSAGRTTQDHFRAAVQYLSSTPYRRTIYTHTGWRNIDDTWVFLSGTGALGVADEKIQVDLKMGRSETNMARYNLPQIPENITQAMQVSLKFWQLTDLTITVPMWAAMYLPPLSPFLTIDFGLWIHGQSGSMKSSIIASALAHFGGWQGNDSKLFLPSNFQSTSNNILMNAFQAKDVPLVIDDFAPGSTQREVNERDRVASNLLRSVGNKAARGRMRDGRRFQADFPPRCLAIVTAEDLPSTASIMARGIGVRVYIPPKGTPERDAIEQRLSHIQTTDSYQYPHAMAGFILWIQRHWQELEKELPVIGADYRDKIRSAGHARLADAFGKIMAAVSTALYFALDCGAITSRQADEKRDLAFTALTTMMKEHSEAVESVDACYIFKDLLLEQLDARVWYLARVEADAITRPLDCPIGAECVGYEDDTCIYLLTKTVTEIIQLHQRLGSPFPVGRNTLYRRLIERDWLIAGDQKTSSTVYLPATNTSPRVLKFIKDKIFD